MGPLSRLPRPTLSANEALGPAQIIVEQHGCEKPAGIKVFEARGESRTVAGTLEMESTEAALELIMACNHHVIKSESGPSSPSLPPPLPYR